jgi:hypothetical protein
MTGSIRSLLLAFLCIFSGRLFSQDAFHEFDKSYGLDPLLYNGKKYSYFMPSGTGGTQFIYSPEFISGEMVIKGYSAAGLDINYDIYNQKLLLRFNDETGASQILEVSEAWLESFRLGDAIFKLLAFNGEKRIYQVLGDGKYQVLYAWSKKLKLGDYAGHSIYTFSLPFKSRFVYIEGAIYPYNSNLSLVKNFPPDLKMGIKKYLKDRDIKVKKATDQAMADLINYISNL